MEGEINTCPDRPGFDNINNFMNYADDACLFNFTKGQMERAQTAWIAYRADNEYYHSKTSDGWYVGANFCERRCRLLVPDFYNHVKECIDKECLGGDTCAFPVSISYEKHYPTMVNGNTGDAGADHFSLFSAQDYTKMYCDGVTLDTFRTYYDIEGDGSIVSIQTSSKTFYPEIAVFKDGCDMNCVVTATQKVHREGVAGGMDLYFYATYGVHYTVVIHGKYGGDFTMSVQSGVSVHLLFDRLYYELDLTKHVCILCTDSTRFGLFRS